MLKGKELSPAYLYILIQDDFCIGEGETFETKRETKEDRKSHHSYECLCLEEPTKGVYPLSISVSV